MLPPALSLRQSFFQSSFQKPKYNPIRWVRSSSIASQSGPVKLETIRTSGELESIKYNWVDGVEFLEKYEPGGYHPIMIGDMLHERYSVVHKLGHGGYSTVWLAWDTRLGRYVSVKVGIANRDFDSFRREMKCLQDLSKPLRSLLSTESSHQKYRGSNSIPLVLDNFELHGPNGIHPCYTTSPARCNLREVSFSCLFPLDVARALSGGLALALAFTHSRGYVHGDVHLRNVLVKLPSSFDRLSEKQLYEKYGTPETIPITLRNGNPPSFDNVPPEAVLPLYLGKDAEEFTLSDAGVLLSDFGESFLPDFDIRHGKDCRTPLAYRAPEAWFEPHAPLSCSSDIWSLATAIWEIIGMKAIFSTEYVDINKVISQHVDLPGLLPSNWWEHWEQRNQFFADNGQPRGGRYVWPPIDRAFEEGVQKYRRMDGMGEFEKEETTAILDLMRRMLAFQPEERPTADEVLKSEWMVKWVLPTVDRSYIRESKS